MVTERDYPMVSRVEQSQRGLLPPASNNYVAAHPDGYGASHAAERASLAHTVHAAGALMTQRPIAHLAKSEDTALTQAQASLLYSAAYAGAAALITGGLMLLAWLVYGTGMDGGRYALLWLLVWGLAVLVALIINRAQGLHYSAAGIAHHEIASRETIAQYAVDQHVALLAQRWQIDPP